ncbi:DUF998 domain-containing protein [Arthrobacter livingstonensis]|nr:DUF998 domain-containing protein [Arthrobacter livingstonensis]
MSENVGWLSGENEAAHAAGMAPRQGPHPQLVPGSRAHRLFLALGLLGSLLFNATFLLDGALRPGYDPLSQPMSALSLGTGGWVQVANFIVFGALTCSSAAGWRATLAPGAGSGWYPGLKVFAGVMLITAGVFTQDPGAGFPPGVPVPVTATVHAQIHTGAAVLSLLATIASLLVLAYRLRREPRWRGWALFAVLTAMAMMGFLSAFGSTLGHAEFAGMFEKLASITPLIFSVIVICRLLLHHGRLAPIPACPQEQERRS